MCACANLDYSLLHTIYKYTNINKVETHIEDTWGESAAI